MTGKTAHMSGEDFQIWLSQMIDLGHAHTESRCAELLGVTPRHILRLKQEGVSLTTALACRALLRGLGPYEPTRETREAWRALNAPA